MAPSTEQIQSLISQMEHLTSNVPADEKLRKNLYETSRKLALALESPTDSVKRIAFEPLQLAVAKVACNLNLFESINCSSSPMSAVDLSKITNADPLLLERILRYLASYGFITEVGEGKYVASNITKALTIPGYRSGIEHHFDFALACWQVLPKFLADTKYQNPSNVMNTPVQIAYHTDLPVFVWAATQPALAPDFNAWMMANHQNTWLYVFPLQDFSLNSTSTAPLFVDVGGGIGHQCIALKSKIPSITRRIVVQDVPQAINHAIPFEGVEPLAYDFFTDQPIKGASFYYMRNVLHDWTDEKCLIILKNTIDALSKDSVILVDELVLPDTGAHWQAAHMDLALMATLAAMERTERQWHALFDTAGLKIERLYAYEDSTRMSIMVVVPKDR